MIIVSILNVIISDSLYSQKIYFDVKNKVIEVNKFLNKEQKISLTVKIDSSANITGNIVVPKIGTSTYKKIISALKNQKLLFPKVMIYC